MNICQKYENRMTIRQFIMIGEEALVGAGAVVVEDVPPGVVVIGVPARLLKQVLK